MSWNYRIVKYADAGYGLHEVHYGPDGEVSSMTESPCRFVGDTPEEVRSSLLRAKMDAQRRPVLDEPMNRNERIRFLLSAIKAQLIFGTPEQMIREIVTDLEREIFEQEDTEQSRAVAPRIATREETVCYKCGRPSVYNEKAQRWVGSCEECMPF